MGGVVALLSSGCSRRFKRQQLQPDIHIFLQVSIIECVRIDSWKAVANILSESTLPSPGTNIFNRLFC